MQNSFLKAWLTFCFPSGAGETELDEQYEDFLTDPDFGSTPSVSIVPGTGTGESTPSLPLPNISPLGEMRFTLLFNDPRQ